MLAAEIFQLVAQLVINEGIEHETGHLLDGVCHQAQLARGADEIPEIFLHGDIIELNQAGAGDGVDGFAGGV